jgi:hypothetical protein
MNAKIVRIFNPNFAFALLLAFGLIFLLQACGDSGQKPDIKTEYSAILFQNGNLLFGKIDKVTSSYIVVTDVYIPQSTVHPETKQMTNFIVKRGSLPWQPDVTYINTSSVALIESIGAESQVAKSIKEEKSKTAAGGQK